MATPHGALYDRMPMSWEDYWALDEEVPSEYLDGHLVMTPSPTYRHQLVCVNLANALKTVLPDGYGASVGWNWTPERGVNFIPDVMVHRTVVGDPIRYTEIPALIVEVLSQNRRDDLIAKRERYARYGVPHYWIVDRSAGTLTGLELADSEYHTAATIGAGPAEIGFGIARITLSVPDLLEL